MAGLIRCALEGSVRLELLTKSALDLHIIVSDGCLLTTIHILLLLQACGK